MYLCVEGEYGEDETEWGKSLSIKNIADCNHKMAVFAQQFTCTAASFVALILFNYAFIIFYFFKNTKDNGYNLSSIFFTLVFCQYFAPVEVQSNAITFL